MLGSLLRIKLKKTFIEYYTDKSSKDEDVDGNNDMTQNTLDIRDRESWLDLKFTITILITKSILYSKTITAWYQINIDIKSSHSRKYK